MIRQEMKKVIYYHYGEVDGLQLIEVDLPTPGEGNVLVKIMAVSVNPLDWKVIVARTIARSFMESRKGPECKGLKYRPREKKNWWRYCCCFA